ncbi:hypothetical protein GF360_03485 [candidate division WWE3 bacterium]|nr:hypothetical protein [candidate division WWE3 bacterium]
MKYEFYIAARWRNKENVLKLARGLESRKKIAYNFIEGDGEQYEFKEQEKILEPEELMEKFESIPNWKNDSKVKEIFEVDIQAIKNSEKLILLLPAGKSAHIEAGIAYGMGKECIVIGEQKEAESLYLIFSKFYETIEDFVKSV